MDNILCCAMPSSKTTYELPSRATSLVVREENVEYGFIGKFQNLKYEYRADIRDRAALGRNFREKFEALNRGYAATVKDFLTARGYGAGQPWNAQEARG